MECQVQQREAEKVQLPLRLLMMMETWTIKSG